jgi:hypothetical protein
MSATRLGVLESVLPREPPQSIPGSYGRGALPVRGTIYKHGLARLASGSHIRFRFVGSNGLPSEGMRKPWKCRLGWHSWVPRGDTQDPSAKVCVRCRKQTYFGGMGGLGSRFGPGG